VSSGAGLVVEQRDGAALGEAQYRGPWEQVVSLLAEEWSPVAWMSLYSPPWTP
jgi:hypothetical protein